MYPVLAPGIFSAYFPIEICKIFLFKIGHPQQGITISLYLMHNIALTPTVSIVFQQAWEIQPVVPQI